MGPSSMPLLAPTKTYTIELLSYVNPEETKAIEIVGVSWELGILDVT